MTDKKGTRNPISNRVLRANQTAAQNNQMGVPTPGEASTIKPTSGKQNH